jgi:tRNA-specific adenosine deaminase 3
MPDLDTNFNRATAHDHLNSTGCHIQCSEGKGRGVYGKLPQISPGFMVSSIDAASKSIPIGTVVEISPVLLFTKEEYNEHGW